MRKIRPVLSGLLVAGFLLGLASLSGCGDPGEGSAPKKKGTRDEINKAFYNQPGNVPATTKKARTWLTNSSGEVGIPPGT